MPVSTAENGPITFCAERRETSLSFADSTKQAATLKSLADTAGALWTDEAKTNVRKRTCLIDWAAQLDQELTSTPWTYFHTHTFRNPVKNHHAINAGPRLKSWLSKWAVLQELSKPQENHAWRCLLWSAEAHMSGDVHLHALSVRTPRELQAHCERCERVLKETAEWRMLKESWWIHHGMARIYPFDPTLKMGAERYVVKYVLDEKCLDWGIETW